MPTGVQLSDLVDDLRAELGQSLTLAHGTATRETYKHLLNRVQQELYDEYDWPGFDVTRDISLLDGSRYYNYDADLPFENISEVVCVDGANNYMPVAYGITLNLFAAIDSAAGQKGWPVARWDNAVDTGQIEVWPIPNQAGTLRQRGYKALTRMTSDSSVCTLDSDLIVMTTAAQMLARHSQEDAQFLLTQARKRMFKLLGKRGSRKRAPWTMTGKGVTRARPGIDYIPSGYGS